MLGIKRGSSRRADSTPHCGDSSHLRFNQSIVQMYNVLLTFHLLQLILINFVLNFDSYEKSLKNRIVGHER